MSQTILLIKRPPGYDLERQYVYAVVLRDWLGLEFVQEIHDREMVHIQLIGDLENRAILLPDVLFQLSPSQWLSKTSLPKRPLYRWDAYKDLPEAILVQGNIPLIFAKPVESERWFKYESSVITLFLDIFGSVFFMLTRYEEIVLPDRDEHGRFPAKASLAYREGFLERPIVDEYVEILWTCMKRLWPGLERKEQRFQLCLSHDVDQPLAAVNKPWPQVLRGIGGDVLKRKDLALAWRRFRARVTESPAVDPYNTFDFIMDLSEKHGLKSAFYFKAGVTNLKYDERYSLNSPWIQQLIRRIHERGHEIGFHPSYETYNNPSLFRTELEAFAKAMDELKISQACWGGRQHYLRWENPATWQIWDEAGLDYDTTLGFADHVGFRCGTCNEIPVFDLRDRRQLRLKERPLVAMDATLLERIYMGLKPAQIFRKLEFLAQVCRRYGGNFTLLWHNVNLTQPWQKDLYLRVLEGIMWQSS